MIFRANRFRRGTVIAWLLGPCWLWAVLGFTQTAAPSSQENIGSESGEVKVAAVSAAKTAKPSDSAPSDVNTKDVNTKPAEPENASPSAYRIGEQDVLNVIVWREPELSGVVVVRPDGKITLPLVNDVLARGLTPDELKDLLTEKLHPFVTVPQVTVKVNEINSRKVYIIGQVGHEGSFRINSTTTVLQIIADAGGLREFANRKRIYVLRNDHGTQKRLNFNYDKVIQGKDVTGNILLAPGDTIVVP